MKCILRKIFLTLLKIYIVIGIEVKLVYVSKKVTVTQSVSFIIVNKNVCYFVELELPF